MAAPSTVGRPPGFRTLSAPGRLLQRWSAHRYATARALAHVQLRRRLRGSGEPVVVFQMGKVGSTTVHRAVEATGRAALQVHVLRPDAIAGTEDVYRQRWSSEVHAGHLFAAQHLRRLIDRHPERRWDVVTLVRDPVARNVSEFLQGDWLGYLNHDEHLDRLDAPDLADRLLDAFLHRYDRHDVPLEWFDDHLAPVFGIDVFDHPFPHDVGWQLIEGVQARLLVLRQEDLGSAGPRGLAELLGTGPVRLSDRNVTGSKRYAPLHRRFLDEVHLPAELVERMYESRYARHFYTDEERSAAVSRWLG